MSFFANRRALADARREAAQWKGDALALHSALVDLMEAVEATPVAIAYQPSAQARVLIQNGAPVHIRVPALTDAGAPIPTAMRAAKEALA